MGKVSFDSTSTTKGMIFQFLVALERCFEMQEGQFVYIERFGDVSVIGDEGAIQIESKYYKRDLTDLDENIWNSISNWMDSSFSLEEFITDDTHKTVWVIHVPRHMKRQSVYAHNKAWQRLDDSLIELTDSRRNAITLLRYDVFTIREPLCNAIAHQDYSLSARIEVVEYEDERLRFKNYGTFLPLSVESVVENDFPELLVMR